jgi:hypothetical protein
MEIDAPLRASRALRFARALEERTTVDALFEKINSQREKREVWKPCGKDWRHVAGMTEGKHDRAD